MFKFYTIMLNFKGSPTDFHPKLERALEAGLSTDWLRVNPYLYLIATGRKAEEVYAALQPILPGGSTIVVMATDMSDRFGWAADVVANWIKRHRP